MKLCHRNQPIFGSMFSTVRTEWGLLAGLSFQVTMKRRSHYKVITIRIYC